MEDKEIMLVGLDIYEFVKNLCNQFLGDSPDMTDGEKKAFKLGIDNTLNLLDQTLNEAINDKGDCYTNIAVHIPGLENNIMTEIADMEELEKEIKKVKEK